MFIENPRWFLAIERGNDMDVSLVSRGLAVCGGGVRETSVELKALQWEQL